jgi:hypothetical protein
MSRLRSDHFTAVQFLIYDVIMAGLIRFPSMLQKKVVGLDWDGVQIGYLIRKIEDHYHNARPTH